jgi:predicted GTPase
VQTAINDGRLTLGYESNMKLDVDLFPMNMVELEGKKVLVQTDQAESTKGKDVVVSDDLRHRMIKPHIPEVDAWKENVGHKPIQRVKPTSNMLIEKYMSQQQHGYPPAR